MTLAESKHNMPHLLMVQPFMGMAGAFVMHPPLGLLYAPVEVIKQGLADVSILDLRLIPQQWEKRLTGAIRPETKVVGISVMTGEPILNACKISTLIKRLRPDIKIVWGGPYATFHPEYILKDEPNCDYVVSGYGSIPLAKLMQRINNEEKPSGIPGVYYRNKSEVVENPADWSCHECIHWRDIPYDLIDDYTVYGQLDHKKTIFSLFSAMGCVYRCGFCSSPALYKNINGKRWVPLPVTDVVDHIEYVVETYGADYIYFIDDDSFVDIGNVESIIDEINHRGIKVRLGFRGARVNEVLKMDDAFLSKLAAAGTDILHIGAESGSDRILEMVRKNCTVSDILSINRKLARHPEIKVFYNFIIGLPTETVDDLKATAKLWMKLIDEHPTCIIGVPNTFRALPGTELFELARESWGYSPPQRLKDFGNFEVESDFDAPWFSKDYKTLANLLIVSSYFVDDKIHKVTEGRSLFYKVLGILSRTYAPIARYRLTHSFLFGFSIEHTLYKLASKILTGVKQVQGSKAE